MKTHILVFLAGFAIGVGGSYLYFNNAYEIVDGCAESECDTKTKEPDSESVMKNITTEATTKDVCAYNFRSVKEVEAKDPVKLDYHVITPQECGELEDDGYIQIEFTYYSDGIVADDLKRPVNNIEELCGPDWASHYGEYEDDSVYIRNDKLKVDYCILKDLMPFSLVLNAKQAQELYSGELDEDE